MFYFNVILPSLSMNIWFDMHRSKQADEMLSRGPSSSETLPPRFLLAMNCSMFSLSRHTTTWRKILWKTYKTSLVWQRHRYAVQWVPASFWKSSRKGDCPMQISGIRSRNNHRRTPHSVNDTTQYNCHCRRPLYSTNEFWTVCSVIHIGYLEDELGLLANGMCHLRQCLSAFMKKRVYYLKLSGKQNKKRLCKWNSINQSKDHKQLHMIVWTLRK